MRFVCRMMTEKIRTYRLTWTQKHENREISLRISSYYDVCILIVRTCAIGHERVKSRSFCCFVAILWMVVWSVGAYMRRQGCFELLDLYKLIGQIRTQGTEWTSFLRYTYFSCTLLVPHSLQPSASVPLKRALQIFANLTILKTSLLPYAML